MHIYMYINLVFFFIFVTPTITNVDLIFLFVGHSADCSLGMSIWLSVIIPRKGGKLHFPYYIGALVK